MQRGRPGPFAEEEVLHGQPVGFDRPSLVIACEAFYYGHIEYADIFGKLRRTDFCFSYKVEGMPLCDPHNEIDPDEK